MLHAHWTRVLLVLGFAWTWAVLAAPAAQADLVSATDVNPDPDVFEAWITADEQDVMIDGQVVHALVYKDDPPMGVPAPAGIPGPQIVVKVGDTVIVHFHSELEPASGKTSIHWHGIELDNNSDGTGVAQDQLSKGDTYVYRFKAHRAGVFWYHPHMKPAHQDHAGMYGPLIVRDADAVFDREAMLESMGAIPTNVRTVVLSDINVDPMTGDVGFDVGGTFKTVNEMIDDCATAISMGMTDPGCGVRRGEIVLVNGQRPDAMAETPVIVARSGEGIRLRLVNTAITRYFRLAGRDADDAHVDLFRIGGEGGFLETVRREGGMPGGYDTKYEQGEILLAPADRADVVIVPQGEDGDVVRIIGRQPDRGAASPPAGDYDVLFIRIMGEESSPFAIAEGDAVLGDGGVEDLKGLTISDHLLAPPMGLPGSPDETIRLTNLTEDLVAGPRIDHVIGHLEDSGGDFTAVPHPASARYARCGDLLELTVKNRTAAHHPFHLHGFSFQPVRILDEDGNSLFEYPYDEFVDNIDIQERQQLVFRVRLEDRPIICDDVLVPYPCADAPAGGAVGRWVFHCHIFHHAALGMISELVVLPDIEPPTIDCPDDLTVECDGAGNAEDLAGWLASASASDNCGLASFTNDFTALSDDCGATGSATVTWTAVDGAGNETQCSATFTIEDTTPPEVGCAVETSVLWPPSHGLVDVGVTASATDVCDDAPVIVSFAVYSDEDDAEATGAGKHAPDASLAGGALRLRAERKGDGDGRVYLIVVRARDACGNVGTGCCTVIVPHDKQDKGKPGEPTAAEQAAAAEAACEANGGPPAGFVLVGEGPTLGPKQ